MSVYRRFFRVDSGQLKDELIECQRQREEAFAEWQKLGDEIGMHPMQDDGKFAGFMPKDRKHPVDSDIFVQPNKQGVTRPKKTTPEGKALQERIDDMPKAPSFSEVVKRVSGFRAVTMCFIEGMRAHNVAYSIRFDEPFVCFISVPWKSVDPDDIAAYAKGELEDGGNRVDREALAFMQWEPPEYFEEVEEWQMDKELAARDQ